jgi:hypothetical protein
MNYTNLQGVSTSLISKFGRDVTLTTAEGKRVRTQAVMTTQSAADETTLTTSYSAQTAIASKVALVSGKLSIVPAVGDTLLVGTETFKVNNVESINPGGTSLLYKLTVA